MSPRRASQPELQALTTVITALALYPATWVTWWAAPSTYAITWYALATCATKALRWDTTHTLTSAHHILRNHAAALIRATAWLLQAITTALLLGLAEAHRRTLPSPN
ncbi:hypothetical protein KCMC57_65240 (plasmid) [Kitasatospora sp. CMC57]|uniref:Uncharacterized protein n=1 Tax=Kitasatospora sp. CMC57 TaxID=3231513 RepID=A0AB33K8D4_9ACTN